MILPVLSRSCRKILRYYCYVIITACHHLEHNGREDDGDHGTGEHDAEGVRDGHVGDGGHGRDDHQGGHGALQQDQHLLTARPG